LPRNAREMLLRSIAVVDGQGYCAHVMPVYACR
jgi:hypothetical protein